MNTDHQHFQYLLQRYADHQISREEYDLLLAYVHEHGINAELETVLDKDWENLAMDFPFAELRSEGLYQKISAGVSFEPVTEKVKPIRLWSGIAVAVAAVAAIVFGVWFFSAQYMNGRHPEFSSGSPLANDIAPGKNTATITLANGKTISLSDTKTGVVIGNDKLSYNDGSEVAFLSPSGRDANGREGSNNKNPLSLQGGSLPEGERSRVQTLIASTPRGGTYEVTLPDGTHVWLNAASSIKFPSKFTGKERIVELSGEAYFEVSKDKTKRFLVSSAGQEVSVLGTHFNINSYADEGSVKTTLLEGSVNVNGIILKPGQQAILQAEAIKVKQANISEAIAWKDGYFRFNNESLASIMRKLEKWYDIEVTVPESLGKKEFTGKISRNKNISRVLKMLEKTNGVHFKIEGRRVIAIE